MKSEQRRTEKVFVWIYTVFSAAMAFGILSCRTGEGAAAVLMPVVLCLAGAWMLFLRQYRDYKTRAYLYAAAMLICYWCYASCANAYYVVLPPFLVVVAALGLFKISRLIWFQTIVFFAVTFWHFAVLHTLRISSLQEFMRLAGQVACVLAVEYLRWNFIRIDIEMEQRLRRTIATLEEMEHSKDEFMAEKLEQAADVLNDEAAEIAMCPMKDGSLYAVREYDLGDDCKLVVELKDQSESAAVTPSIVPLATSGSNEMWKYPYVSAGYLDGIYALKESNSTGAFPD